MDGEGIQSCLLSTYTPAMLLTGPQPFPSPPTAELYIRAAFHTACHRAIFFCSAHSFCCQDESPPNSSPQPLHSVLKILWGWSKRTPLRVSTCVSV